MSCISKSSASSSEDDGELRRGPWTLEEDNLLIHYISRHGEGRWNLLANRSGLKRTGKSCRLRWLNYLKPDVKRGNLTPQEQLLILELHSKWGNRWSKIAQHLPGRTDNEIKNYWRTRVQKQARHLKIDANSTAFQDIIRCFWVPRLVQKIEGSSSFSAISSQNSTPPLPLDHTNNSQHLSSPRQPPPPPPQVLGQGEPLNESEPMQNSDSDHCTSSCISSSESLSVSQISKFSEYPTSPFHPICNTDYNTYGKDCYYVDSSCYDMETVNVANMSAMGDFENPVRSCHVAESNWVHDDLADSLWNMDELWQIRNSPEKGNL